LGTEGLRLMKTSARLSLAFNARRENLPLAVVIVIALSVLLGMLLTDTTEEMVAYLLVTLTAAASCALWIHAGAKSIPIMPAVSVMYFVYYALPILRSVSRGGFEPSEILTAAATAALFLVAATLSWGLLFMGIARPSDSADPEVVSGSQLERLMFV